MRVMPKLEAANEISHKIIGRHYRQSSLYVALNKKLLSDISNQQKIPSITISEDATNYYVRITYPSTSLLY